MSEYVSPRRQQELIDAHETVEQQLNYAAFDMIMGKVGLDGFTREQALEEIRSFVNRDQEFATADNGSAL